MSAVTVNGPNIVYVKPEGMPCASHMVEAFILQL